MPDVAFLLFVCLHPFAVKRRDVFSIYRKNKPKYNHFKKNSIFVIKNILFMEH